MHYTYFHLNQKIDGYKFDFRESLYRMISVLTGMSTTVLMTAELDDIYICGSASMNAFLANAIILALRRNLRKIQTRLLGDQGERKRE